MSPYGAPVRTVPVRASAIVSRAAAQSDYKPRSRRPSAGDRGQIGRLSAAAPGREHVRTTRGDDLAQNDGRVDGAMRATARSPYGAFKKELLASKVIGPKTA